MKNKLELNHIAPYLPHGLKMIFTYTNKIGQISNIYTIGRGYDNDDIKISIDNSDGEHIWMYKPILRPLSDLNKKIQKAEFYMTYKEHLELTEYFKSRVDMDEFNDLRDVPYSDIEKLLKHHFDVFGLIEKGLAIDKNTL